MTTHNEQESFGSRARRLLRRRVETIDHARAVEQSPETVADNALIRATRGESIRQDHLERVLAERKRMEAQGDE